MSMQLENSTSTCQRPGMKSGVGSTQTKNFGHYIHFAGNVLLWGKSVVRIEIHFFKSKCFQGSYSSQDADVEIGAEAKAVGN